MGTTDQNQIRKPIRRADRAAAWPLKLSLCLLGLCFLICLYIAPLQTVLKTSAMIAWFSVAVALIRIFASLYVPKPSQKVVRDTELPNYTVLVPLFHEDNMVADLMSNLARLNYPKDKLEIMLICEEIDPSTISAAKRQLSPPFKLIIVPPGQPQTKPRALNYALQFSNGELVTIYDAEDRPHPEQLRAAVKAFEDHEDWAAIQAPLDYFNMNDSFLTRQFTLEYAALFHVWLPFLAWLKIPFPLGGTSNHMRRSVLDACNGWDAHNVTEDADLSFRLAADGHHIGYITPATQEEAVSGLKAWYNQRARWMKGYMQTWLVHMHTPLKPLNGRGLLRFLSLQFTLGYTLICALVFTPVIIGAALYGLAHYLVGWSLPFSTPHFIALGISLSVGILIGMVGAYRAGQAHLLPWALLMPIYWMLLFWPTLRALFELHSQPFHWHKTTHGVSASRNTYFETENLTAEQLPAE